MKIGEKIHAKDDGSVIIEKVHTFQPELERAKMLRTAGKEDMGESKLVGTVPIALVWEWCKEAGVKWDDIHGRKEVLKKKLLSSENKNLRVWQGRY